MITLRPRLKSAADMVKQGEPLADIGTDHAYLPAFLVLNGIIPRAVACDIGEKPLRNAAQTLRVFSLAEKIELRISDGLKEICRDEVKNISICGMGGNLISEILSACDWICTPGLRLILQPMTHSEDVRRWLCENGFRIISESCVRDGSHVYCCMSAEYSGCFEKKSPGYFYFGENIGKSGAAERYVAQRLKSVQTRLGALTALSCHDGECEILREILNYYDSMIKT